MEETQVDHSKRVFLDGRRVRHRKCGVRLFDLGEFPWGFSVGFWCRGCDKPIFLPWEVLEGLREEAEGGIDGSTGHDSE